MSARFGFAMAASEGCSETAMFIRKILDMERRVSMSYIH